MVGVAGVFPPKRALRQSEKKDRKESKRALSKQSPNPAQNVEKAGETFLFMPNCRQNAECAGEKAALRRSGEVEPVPGNDARKLSGGRWLLPVLVDAQPFYFRFQGLPWNPESCGRPGRPGYPAMARGESCLDHLHFTICESRMPIVRPGRVW